MTRLAWFSDRIQQPSSLTLATGAGFASEQAEGEFAVLVDDILQDRRPGWLARSAAVLSLFDGKERAFVMLQDTATGAWRFPSSYLEWAELPLAAACRSLVNQVRIGEDSRGWGEARIRVGGGELTWLTDDGIQHLRARWVPVDERPVVEFFYPMELLVDSLDKDPVTPREGTSFAAGQFTWAEVLEMLSKGQLTAETARIVRTTEAANPST